MKNAILIVLLILSVLVVSGQEKEKKSRKEKKAEKNAELIEQTKNLVDSKNFVFVPRTANPMSGKAITLTGGYDLTLNNDSVTSYLPYYGRAYSAAYGVENPMRFNLPVSDYTSEKTKKGYEVRFSVKNANDLINLTFHIMETGSATLQVNSTNRQGISYYGVLETQLRKK